MNLRFFLIYILLGILVLLRIVLTPEPSPFPNGAQIHAQTRLMTTPQMSGNSQRLSLDIQGRKVTLLTSRFADFQYGDLLDIRGTVTHRVLENGKAVSTIYFPKIRIVEEDMALPFHLAGWIRERVRTSVRLFLPPNEANLLIGVVFGVNEGFQKEVKEAFQVTGVMHVIAASGMNVTLLAGFLLPLLGRILRRDHALMVTIVCLGFYALLAGLSASIVRATLMASIGFLGLLLGRQRTALLLLYITGCIMLGITPSLLTDIGFQLSFAATAGILLIKPLFPKLAQWKVVNVIGEDMTTTLAAQITTLPLLLYYFHSIGLLSVPVNILVLWVIPPVMVIGSLGAVVSLISMTAGGLFCLAALPFLSYFLFLTTAFAKVSPHLEVTKISPSLIVGYYLLVLATIMLRKRLRPVSTNPQVIQDTIR